MLYIAIIVAALVPVFYFMLKKNIQKKEESKKDIIAEYDYPKERNIALNITLAHLALVNTEKETIVYGIIMDMDLGSSFMTLACYITGAANLYFSNGKTITGAGKSPEVSVAALNFVKDTEYYLSETKLVIIPPQPITTTIQFIFLTNNGKYYTQESLANIQDNSSIWMELFQKGSKVIETINANT